MKKLILVLAIFIYSYSQPTIIVHSVDKNNIETFVVDTTYNLGDGDTLVYAKTYTQMESKLYISNKLEEYINSSTTSTSTNNGIYTEQKVKIEIPRINYIKTLKEQLHNRQYNVRYEIKVDKNEIKKYFINNNIETEENLNPLIENVKKLNKEEEIEKQRLLTNTKIKNRGINDLYMNGIKIDRKTLYTFKTTVRKMNTNVNPALKNGVLADRILHTYLSSIMIDTDVIGGRIQTTIDINEKSARLLREKEGFSKSVNFISNVLLLGTPLLISDIKHNITTADIICDKEEPALKDVYTMKLIISGKEETVDFKNCVRFIITETIKDIEQDKPVKVTGFEFKTEI